MRQGFIKQSTGFKVGMALGDRTDRTDRTYEGSRLERLKEERDSHSPNLVLVRKALTCQRERLNTFSARSSRA